FDCNWQPTTTGNVTLKAIATDAQDLTASAQVQIAVEKEMVEPPPAGELCEDFNVYPDWTRSDHAIGGDIMVHNNIAYSANWWTSSIPGSDSS
ncbi:hypothetical protein HKB16_01425, partial [Vibrio parahaemolyticus]|nr:hypothetical protein [Vibrio parahaemolyticus]